MQIRVAVPADIPAVFEVRTSVRENHLSLAELAALGITPQTLPAMLAGDGRGWVAEEGGQVAAFAMADAAEACVFALFVRPGHEGRGLGRALLAEAERWLAARGCGQAWLLTEGDPATRANGFYRHLGWHNEGLQPDGQNRYAKRLDRAAQAGGSPVDWRAGAAAATPAGSAVAP